MGRSPCCAKEGLNRGAWTAVEDRTLSEYIKLHGEGGWRNLPMKAGLKRCGKSCRLRWLNYLRPDIKRGNISSDEEELIVRLHKLLGNRWSLIAGRLPGRTDNEIKNYWNTNLSKRVHQEYDGRSSSTIGNNERKSQKAKEVVSSHNAVRTKASKCNKVFINTNLQSKGLFLANDHKPMEAIDHHEANKNEVLSSSSLPENSSSDFLADFCIDSEICLTSLLGYDHLFSEELLQNYWSKNVVGENCDDDQCHLNPIINYKSFSSFIDADDANQGDWLELAD